MLQKKKNEAKFQLMSQVASSPKKMPETLKVNLDSKVKTTKKKGFC
jgi:hypothetical protein